jgi:hypothetical protein
MGEAIGGLGRVVLGGNPCQPAASNWLRLSTDAQIREGGLTRDGMMDRFEASKASASSSAGG